MRVFRLQLLGVLEDGLGVLLRNLFAVAPRVLDLLDLLDRLELDEQDDRVDLVVVEPLHGFKVNVEDAMLVLEHIQRIVQTLAERLLLTHRGPWFEYSNRQLLYRPTV